MPFFDMDLHVVEVHNKKAAKELFREWEKLLSDIDRCHKCAQMNDDQDWLQMYAKLLLEEGKRFNVPGMPKAVKSTSKRSVHALFYKVRFMPRKAARAARDACDMKTLQAIFDRWTDLLRQIDPEGKYCQQYREHRHEINRAKKERKNERKGIFKEDEKNIEGSAKSYKSVPPPAVPREPEARASSSAGPQRRDAQRSPGPYARPHQRHGGSYSGPQPVPYQAKECSGNSAGGYDKFGFYRGPQNEQTSHHRSKQPVTPATPGGLYAGPQNVQSAGFNRQSRRSGSPFAEGSPQNAAATLANTVSIKTEVQPSLLADRPRMQDASRPSHTGDIKQEMEPHDNPEGAVPSSLPRIKQERPASPRPIKQEPSQHN